MREFPVPLPRYMQHLPVDKRGFPVPAFVHWIDGENEPEPDFRIVDPAHMVRCVKQSRCWICGDIVGTYKAFVIGPMCCVNGISSEPPSHLACAEFAAQVCPFLSQPLAKRPDKPVPVETHKPAGIMLAHNPGVTAVWVTKRYGLTRAPGGVLFQIGKPETVAFWAKGRRATRQEVNEAVAKGLPHLQEMAHKDGRAAERDLVRMVAAFSNLLDDVLPHPLPDVDLSTFEAVS